MIITLLGRDERERSCWYYFSFINHRLSELFHHLCIIKLELNFLFTFSTFACGVWTFMCSFHHEMEILLFFACSRGFFLSTVEKSLVILLILWIKSSKLNPLWKLTPFLISFSLFYFSHLHLNEWGKERIIGWCLRCWLN